VTSQLPDFPRLRNLKSQRVISRSQIVTLVIAQLEVPIWHLKLPRFSCYCSGVQISLRAMARAVSASSSAITPQSSNSRT
jgi:hypothetical protein